MNHGALLIIPQPQADQRYHLIRSVNFSHRVSDIDIAVDA